MKHILRRAITFAIASVLVVPMYFLFWFNGKNKVALTEIWEALITDYKEK